MSSITLLAFCWKMSLRRAGKLWIAARSAWWRV